MDRKESKLTKAEKRAAKKSYEDEKRASVPYSRPSYAPYYPTSGQALASIPAFNQRGWWVSDYSVRKVVSRVTMTLTSSGGPCVFSRRPLMRGDDKPVASVRPIQSTPIPMMPRQVAMGMAGSSVPGGLPVNSLQKAGVQVQRIVTRTGNTDSGLLSILILLDLSVAFDTITHSIHFNQLAAIELTNKPLDWFHSYLSSYTQFIQLNHSHPTTISGVPQGSVFGPFLFTVLYSIHNIDFHCFADDNQLYVSSKATTSLCACLHGIKY